MSSIGGRHNASIRRFPGGIRRLSCYMYLKVPSNVFVEFRHSSVTSVWHISKHSVNVCLLIDEQLSFSSRHEPPLFPFYLDALIPIWIEYFSPSEFRTEFNEIDVVSSWYIYCICWLTGYESGYKQNSSLILINKINWTIQETLRKANKKIHTSSIFDSGLLKTAQ